MHTVLYVNNRDRHDSVSQLGRETGQAMVQSKRYKFVYVEANSSEEVMAARATHNPTAAMFNWHQYTMPWLNYDVALAFNGPIATAVHDIEYWNITHAHMHLNPVFPESPARFRIRRQVQPYDTPPPIESEIPIIGTFGFGCGGHSCSYPRLVDVVNAHFDTAIIRMNLSPAHYGDPEGSEARKLAELCRRKCKPGIALVATHEWLPYHELYRWLAGNHINCFLYPMNYGCGCSSSLDYALAVRRPIAITKSWMMRHLYHTQPSICVEDRSLRDIMADGPEPLDWARKEFTMANVISDYERVADFLCKDHKPVLDPQR